jgi:hypothetical protein
MDALEPILREIAPQIPIVVDRMLNVDAVRQTVGTRSLTVRREIPA